MKTESLELNKFVTKWYLYSLFRWMGFIIPFMTIMFNEKLTATQIAIVMIASKVVQISTEIPSGAIADKFNRKYVLIFANALNVVPLTIWIFFPTFWGYLIGFIFFGLRDSLNSGCQEAFVYDELNRFKKRNLFERVSGRAGALSSVGIFVASIGAFVFTKLGFGYNFLMFASIVTTIIAVITLSTIKPTKKIKDSDEPEDILTYMETLKNGVKYAFSHKFVLKLILFLSFATTINIGVDEYSGIFYNEITNDLTKVAVLFALMQIAYAVGEFSGEYLKALSFKQLIILFFLASLCDPLVFYIYKYPISIIISILDTMLIVAIYVNFRGKMNDCIPSKIRAATLSVQGFIEGFGMLICLFLFGLAVDYFENYRMGFLIFSCLFAIGSFVFLISFINDKNLK